MMHSEYGFKVDKKIGLNAKQGDDINTFLRNVIGLKNGNEHLYFNDGVLLIDLELWRSMNILGLAIDFLRRNPDCLYLGQDALNAVLATRYTILDDRWNSLAIAAHEGLRPSPSDRSKPISAITRASFRIGLKKCS
jgi:lipopolysaccharide biosynthesis glycosyltransferase